MTTRNRSCAGTAFFFNDTATTEIYTLSLHDALPIFRTTAWGSIKSPADYDAPRPERSEEHTSELQPQSNLVCRLLLEKHKTHHAGPRAQRHDHAGNGRHKTAGLDARIRPGRARNYGYGDPRYFDGAGSDPARRVRLHLEAVRKGSAISGRRPRPATSPIDFREQELSTEPGTVGRRTDSAAERNARATRTIVR